MNKSSSHYNPEDKKSTNGIDAKPCSILHKPVLKEIIPSNTMRDEFPTKVTFKLSNYLYIVDLSHNYYRKLIKMLTLSLINERSFL